VDGELVDERGGGVIEQVGVVDQQQSYAGQELDRAVQGWTLSGSRCANAAKGSERVSGVPVILAQSLPRTASVIRRVLPAAGRTGHHDAGPARRQRAADQLQFVLPAGERPGQFQGLRILFESHHTDRSPVTHA